MRNYYQVLGVGPSADVKNIRASYLRLIRKYHPDRFSGDKAYAERFSAMINEAYTVLSDSGKRAAYDAQLAAGRAKAANGFRGASPPVRLRYRTGLKTRTRKIGAINRGANSAGQFILGHFTRASNVFLLLPSQFSRLINQGFAVLSDSAHHAANNAKSMVGRAKAATDSRVAALPVIMRDQKPPKSRRGIVGTITQEARAVGRLGLGHLLVVAIVSLLLLGSVQSLTKRERIETAFRSSGNIASSSRSLEEPARVDKALNSESAPNAVAAVEVEETSSKTKPPDELAVAPPDVDSRGVPQREILAASRLPDARLASSRNDRSTAVSSEDALIPTSTLRAEASSASVPRSSPRSAVMSPQVRADLGAQIHRKLQSCADRQISPGAGASRIVTSVNLRLNPDGSLASGPTVLRQTGLDNENRQLAERVAELAVAEFAGCSSIQGLPEELYAIPGGWRSVTFNYRFP